MIAYAVFEVTDLQGYVELLPAVCLHGFPTESRRLVALRTSELAAYEVVSHKSSLNDYVVEEWEVLG